MKIFLHSMLLFVVGLFISRSKVGIINSLMNFSSDNRSSIVFVFGAGDSPLPFVAAI
jgi:hypothetical protein